MTSSARQAAGRNSISNIHTTCERPSVKMQGLVAMSLLVSTLANVVITNAACPSGCTCETDRISCEQLTAFPQPFASEAKTIEIHMSYLPEIPPNAFKDLSNVEHIHFKQTEIGVIKPCAFDSLNANTFIEIDLTEIGTIEGGAFRGLRLKEISISSSIIGRIESFAFDHLRGLNLFQIHSTDVQLVQHHAFYSFNEVGTFNVFDANITALQSDAFYDFTGVSTMDMYHCTFQDLECNTLEKLRFKLGRHFSFHSLDVNCDCGIAWLLEASQSESSLRLDDVICYAPPQRKDVHLKNLTRNDLCHGGSSPECKSPPLNPPENCDGSTSASQRLDLSYVQLGIVLVLKHLLK